MTVEFFFDSYYLNQESLFRMDYYTENLDLDRKENEGSLGLILIRAKG